ncbi:MAG TPA: hypothetical protein DCQ27_06555, partial [Micrococcus luteus]|nr:hypothetical protein [Micrococcus luteus]
MCIRDSGHGGHGEHHDEDEQFRHVLSLAAAAAPSSDTATPPPPGDPETGASHVSGSTEPQDGMRQITW